MKDHNNIYLFHHITQYIRFFGFLQLISKNCGFVKNKVYVFSINSFCISSSKVNFIFRGVEDSEFQLIPSALRGDNINSFVDESFDITLWVDSENIDEYNQITEKNLEYIKGMLYPVRFNKYIMLLISSEINIRLWKKKTGEMNFLIIILKLK